MNGPHYAEDLASLGPPLADMAEEILTPSQILLRREIPNSLALVNDDPLAMLQALKRGANELALHIRHGGIEYREAEEALLNLGIARGLQSELGNDVVAIAIHRALMHYSEPPISAGLEAEFPPPPESPDDYGIARADSAEPAKRAAPLALVNAADWPNEAPPPVSWVVR